MQERKQEAVGTREREGQSEGKKKGMPTGYGEEIQEEGKEGIHKASRSRTLKRLYLLTEMEANGFDGGRMAGKDVDSLMTEANRSLRDFQLSGGLPIRSNHLIERFRDRQLIRS